MSRLCSSHKAARMRIAAARSVRAIPGIRRTIVTGDMIFQWRADGPIAITQPVHALLAGQIAEAWGNESTWRPSPWDPLVAATRRHDDGHAEWEAAPTLNANGAPHDFISIPNSERLRIFSKCVEMVDDPHIALLVSMHVTGLLLGRLEPGSSRLIDSLNGNDLEEAESFVASQQLFQHETQKALDARYLIQQYRLLQVFDRLSLILCMQPPGHTADMTINYVPLVRGATEQEMTMKIEGEKAFMSPYPFGSDKVRVSIKGKKLSGHSFRSIQEYHRALAQAPDEEIGFKFVRG